MLIQEWLLKVQGIDKDILWLQREFQKVKDNEAETEYAQQVKKALESNQKIKDHVSFVIGKIGNRVQKSLLKLYYIEGKTWKEVAAKLSYSLAYVKGPLRRSALDKASKIREKYSL